MRPTPPRSSRPGARIPALAWIALCGALACATAGPLPGPRPPPPPEVPLAGLRHEPVPLDAFSSRPEALTVEKSWILDLYTLLHRRDYTVARVVFPSAGPGEAVAHLALPDGEARHPLAIVLPILGGTHVVSELVSKGLVGRGFAVARLERTPLGLETEREIDPVVERIRVGILDARRLLDWLVLHPRIDPDRVAAVGTSLGSLQAATLLAVDTRVRGGLLLLPGGDMAQILAVSREGSVRVFRERFMNEHGIDDPEVFARRMRPVTRTVDPLTFAHRIEPGAVMIVSGRLDRVIPPARTRELWAALGGPRWEMLPTGHYLAFPFIFRAIARGAEHLREHLGAPDAPELAPGSGSASPPSPQLTDLATESGG